MVIQILHILLFELIAASVDAAFNIFRKRDVVVFLTACQQGVHPRKRLIYKGEYLL